MSRIIPFKLSLNISHTGRHIYQDFQMTFAQDPELEQELLNKVLAFCYFATPELEIVTEVSSKDSPCLWRRSVTEQVLEWIEISKIDEKEIKRSLTKSEIVKVLLNDNEESRAWLAKTQKKFMSQNIEVYLYNLKEMQELENVTSRMLGRSMRLNAYIEDNMILLSDDNDQLEIYVEKVL